MIQECARWIISKRKQRVHPFEHMREFVHWNRCKSVSMEIYARVCPLEHMQQCVDGNICESVSVGTYAKVCPLDHI